MCGNGFTPMKSTGAAGNPDARPASPSETLLAHLNLPIRATAEVEDLYSQPISSDVIPLVTGEHRLPQPPAAAGQEGRAA